MRRSGVDAFDVVRLKDRGWTRIECCDLDAGRPSFALVGQLVVPTTEVGDGWRAHGFR